MSTFKPMLAVDHDPAKLRFPLLASPKLDGLRCAIQGGVPLSRTLKRIPSLHVQKQLGNNLFDGFDGELIVGDPTAPNVFSNTTSHVMAHDKIFNYTYYVFDLHDKVYEYNVRRELLRVQVDAAQSIIGTYMPDIRVLQQTWVRDLADVAEYESEQVELGYEGIILRDPQGRYKYGRSTVNEGLLLKVKRFEDSEAVIIGFVEQMQNTNDKVTNELGRGKRSSHKEGMVGKDTLGALHVRDLKTGMEFYIGTGFNDELRLRIWRNQGHYLGKICTYKFFPVGVKDLPRHPVFKGFRHKDDM